MKFISYSFEEMEIGEIYNTNFARKYDVHMFKSLHELYWREPASSLKTEECFILLEKKHDYCIPFSFIKILTLKGDMGWVSLRELIHYEKECRFIKLSY